MRIKSCPVQIKAAGTQDGTEDGVFEAIVAAYSKDSWGDKILPGAFADTLAEWQAKGDPIPVLWSHMSHDPDYHIGVVLDAKERDGEGLWVQGRIDLDEPGSKAAKVYRLLKGRRVTQFSFAYDVVEGAWIDKRESGEDQSYYELRKLKLYEVGPTLIGVNQDTELMDVKSADGRQLRLSLAGTLPGEADTIRLAVETALGVTAGKAGRVLSAKNEQTLTDALDKINGGTKDIKTVLDAVANTDDDSKAAPQAIPAAPATTPACKAGVDQPATPAPASVLLRADLDSLLAEV